MTTEPSEPSEPTEPMPPVPAAASARSRSRRRTKRHPAAASRILAAGLATASTFGLIAVLGSRPELAESTQVVAVDPTVAAPASTVPAPVVVVRRTYVQIDGGVPPATTRTSAAPSVRASAGVPAAPQPAAPVTAVPRRTAPVTRSSSS